MKLMIIAALAAVFSIAALRGADTNAIKAPTAAQVAAAGTEYGAGPYVAGKVTLSAFGTYRAHVFDGKIERFGAGLGLEYFLANNISVEPYFVSEGAHWNGAPFTDSFTDAGLNFKGYLPLGSSGLAAYGLIGFSHGFGAGEPVIVGGTGGSERLRLAKRTDDERMAAGVGLSLRGAGKVLGITPGAFVDAVWLNNFVQPGHALLRLGLSGAF